MEKQTHTSPPPPLSKNFGVQFTAGEDIFCGNFVCVGENGLLYRSGSTCLHEEGVTKIPKRSYLNDEFTKTIEKYKQNILNIFNIPKSLLFPESKKQKNTWK